MNAASSYYVIDRSRSRSALQSQRPARGAAAGGLRVNQWITPWIHSLHLEASDDLVIALHREGECNVRAMCADNCSDEQSIPGQLTSMPAGSDYAFRVEGAVRFETIHVPHDRILGVAKRHSLDSSIPDFRFAFRDAFVGGCIDAIQGEAAAPGPRSEEFIRSVTDSLLLHVLRNSVARTPFKPKSCASIDRSRALIESNLAECLSLEALAEEAGISRSHFARRFRAEMGVSPHRYQSQRRVEIAKRMLQETGMSLVDIAMELGFCSQSHFTQVFRASAGMTPRKFRGR